MPRNAMLYQLMDDSRVSCYLCSHHCTIAPQKFGFCGMRENMDGELYTHAYGEVIAANPDPVEKKPLYHFLPGTFSFSIAAPGCNFHCGFCQNWQISQVSEHSPRLSEKQELSPAEIVRRAMELGCRSISYTYTEPTIFFEYAFETAREAMEKGLYNVFVTNGFMTPEALNTIEPYLDACNVDLKSFRDEFYRKTCKGRLEPVLETIRLMKKMGIWVEITTLVIPGQNDGVEELSDIARFIFSVDRSIPWHISRFHPDYEFGWVEPTPPDALRRAQGIGKEAGLHHVYVGNVRGGDRNIVCPNCGNTVVARTDTAVLETRIKENRCGACGETVPGIFAE
jgi:pyruvate formate lyase activating enzyme